MLIAKSKYTQTWIRIVNNVNPELINDRTKALLYATGQE